jgi:hypothetical protein
MMKKVVPAANPEAYVAALAGWRRECVVALRTHVRAAAKLEEVIKWGHLVYRANGPVLLIRAEERRVLFGFWRGQRLREIEPRLKAGGKYEMATIELSEGDPIAPAVVRKLVREAVRLNDALGDPTDLVRSKERPIAAGVVSRKASKTAKPKAAKHVVHHADGSVWAKGSKIGEAMTGYWEWFRKDGTKLRSGFFKAGRQVGRWTTYDKKGNVYKVTEMKSAPAKSAGRGAKTAG